MSAFLANLVTLIISTFVLLLIIGVLVLVHELGHFLAAKLCGVKVNEFAIGFGKKLWSKEYKGTLYRINLLPLGGFVAMEGEDGTENNDPGNYNNKSWPAKALILLGGIFMNTLLAVILFAIFLPIINHRVIIRNESAFTFSGANQVDTGVLVTNFAENSVVAGKLEVLDLIYQTQGQTIADSASFQKSLADNQGREYTIKSRHVISGQEKEVTVVLPVRETLNQPILGIGFVPYYIIHYPENLGAAVSHSWNIFAYQLQVLTGRVQMAFQQRDASIVSDQLGSVVAVGVIVEDLLSSGQAQEIINLIALVSLSLAFFNLLPIPALDGGHLLVVTIESLTRRKFNRRLLNTVNQAGFIALMGLGFLIIFKDVIQFEILQRLGNWLGSIIPR